VKVTRTALEGVVVIEPKVFSDRRGWFSETFSERDFAETVGASVSRSKDHPCNTHFVQDNSSYSVRGVVRGLHFQKEPHAQAKLVRVAVGRILDVALDMRRSSPTFGQWTTIELSAENHRQFYLPRGIAHGFSVLSEEAVVIYKVDGYYAPEDDGGVLWNDPALGIDWGIDHAKAVVSEKDAALPLFANTYKFE
jgi:dTDP-4-dehydrorhamnose 3,5-epimerase